MAKSRKRGNTNTSRRGPARSHVLFVSILAGAVGIICFYIFRYDWARKLWSEHSVEDGGFFEVTQLPGKGMGLVALRDIEPGQLLIREKPLFTVPSQISSSPASLIWSSLARVTPSERDAFLNLSYVHFPPHLSPEDHPEEVALAIFQTNAVSAGDNVGIFPQMARLNHGCSSAFNAVYSWRESEGVLVVHALKEIRKGEELLTTYTDTKRPRRHRREYLSTQYGFSCTCAVCSLPSQQSRASDRRLNAMVDKYQRLSTWAQGSIGKDEAIKLTNEIWALGEEEGYWSERGRLAADAAWVAAAHSDIDAMKAWALRAKTWYSRELGGDSEQAQEMESVLERPQSHRAWGTRSSTKG
ncbi:hypothetical protein PLEOSDRAFT_1066483 [Pleurotus ostreatus PC15]|uniref:SET domain-containing protein n=1 Tax=Pleurotus ostreatus (strain PC15) TaxID=1137138 RepID=A0A067NP19_PLEO1|nr:hypothetical protein PLEOSDRAFT_1066483 [Pleurotus ostreatus PC15]